MTNEGQKQIAGAIIIAGVLIAGAILLKGNSAPIANNNGAALKDIKIRPVSAEEHILGNPDAKLVIVEYSDTECPFCKVFHATMHQALDKSDGKVAWVYRHFPIPQLHQKAALEAEATECAWEQGGNDVFWKYIDELFVRTLSNDRLEASELPKIAKDIDLDVSAFNNCLESGKYEDKVQADIDDGSQAGVNGTPKSFILKKGKLVDTIDGAEPIESVMQKIEKALK